MKSSKSWIESTFAFSDMADAWKQRFAVFEDLEKLRDTLIIASPLTHKAESWRLVFKDENVAKLQMELKDASYDAEDLLDEFHYHELRHKEEEIANSIMEGNQSITSGNNPDKNILSIFRKRVEGTLGRLDRVASQLKASMNLGDEPSQLNKVMPRETGFFMSETEQVILGREEEKETIIGMLLEPDQNNEKDTKTGMPIGSRDQLGYDDVEPAHKRIKRFNVSIFSLVGIGGIGKTSLAKLIYDDRRVKDHFDVTFWVCASENFNAQRIMQELVGNKRKNYLLETLQAQTRELIMGKKFLLVLDDLWKMDSGTWERLCVPLMHGLEGSTILVTTRSLKVAELSRTKAPIILNGLSETIYWELFKKYAFNSENPVKNSTLEDIGRKIASKLSGTPLAAKTLGGLLSVDMDKKRWEEVLNSDMWELEDSENHITAALRLSYLYLPDHLKRCMLLCSMFIKNYAFDKELLVNMWLAQGSFWLREMNELKDGEPTYLFKMVTNSFFSRSKGSPQHFIMENAMHDIAKSISMGEFFRMEDDNIQSATPNLRHLLVDTENLELGELLNFGNFKNLHSLLILGNFLPNLDFTIDSWCNELANLRWLKLSHCDITVLPESIGNLIHLRYLDIAYTGINYLPESLCELYYLKVLDMRACPLLGLPKAFKKLINLRNIYGNKELYARISEIGKLTSLRDLPQFVILKNPGHRIEELGGLTQLRGYLWVKNLENIESKEDAKRAMLHNKEYLEKIILDWSTGRNFRLTYDDRILDEEVLENLRPHSNLTLLQIGRYCGGSCPSWLHEQSLPCLTRLWLKDCYFLREIPSLPRSLGVLRLENMVVDSLPVLWGISCSSLVELHLETCPYLRSLDDWLLPDRFPSLASIRISSCHGLVNLPAEKIEGLRSLENLEIISCPSISALRNLALPSSIKKLVLDHCGGLEKSVPYCLEKLTSLVTLKLSNSPHITSLQFHLFYPLSALRNLSISNCEQLSSLEGLASLPSLKELSISKCAKLTYIECSTLDAGTSVACSSLEALKIDHTTLIRLSSLRNPPPILRRLTIFDSPEDQAFVNVAKKWFRGLKFLKEICFRDCANLTSLPEELSHVTSLETLHIYNCPEMKSLPTMGLPTSLRSLDYSNCDSNFVKQLEDFKATIVASHDLVL